MNKKTIVSILLAVFVYIFFTGVSYFLLSTKAQTQKITTSSSGAPVANVNGKTVFSPTLPKTEACPLNGVLYPKVQKDWWDKHRPLGVMIENHQNARPQSGLSSADVIYEAVAEGSITRFLAVFYCQDAGQVGPVRSARTYFLDFISEYGSNPLYAHVGGANTPGPADALSQITQYDWTGYNDLNQFSIGFPVFWRDYNRLGHETATEHTMYSATEKLWTFAGASRGLTNVDKDGVSWDKNFVPYGFTDDAASAKPTAQTIHLEFWASYSDYFVDWSYDKASNSYKRSNGKAAHIDLDNNKQLNAKNIVVLFMKQSNANDGYEDNVHLLYTTKGTGRAIIFKDGMEIKGTWSKNTRTSRTLLFDSNGNPIKFNRGLIWFEILPTDGVVSVK
ncbi:MAG: DUF3048 domain-containing protein [Candidatus Levybacteria bacterium]|nr:DUF3048 domain-containing protein [Candidatus Levybacteria bacterium]